MNPSLERAKKIVLLQLKLAPHDIDQIDFPCHHNQEKLYRAALELPEVKAAFSDRRVTPALVPLSAPAMKTLIASYSEWRVGRIAKYL